MSKCGKCGYDDKGTGDSAHYCPVISGPLSLSMNTKDMAQSERELFKAWHAKEFPLSRNGSWAGSMHYANHEKVWQAARAPLLARIAEQ